MDNRPVVGGQAVMEGVMMRSGSNMAVTVRQSSGRLVIKNYKPSAPDGKVYKKWPFIRGVINFGSMLKLGVQCLNDSVKMLGLEEEEPSGFEKWLARKTGKNAMDILSGFSMVLGIGLAIVIFIVTPNLITSLLSRQMSNSLAVNLIEGAIRLAIFVGYLSLISLMKDIKRFFAYHGAEHKVVNAFERDRKLTVENVRQESTAHPRCGTSFLVLVMIISVIVFSLTGWAGQVWWQRLLIRLALIIPVASISYEALMGLARFDNLLVRAIRWPGMQVQKMTTREPDDDMIRAAIASALSVMPGEWRQKAMPEGYEMPEEFTESPERQEETV